MVELDYLQSVTSCFKLPNEATPTFIVRLITSVENLDDEFFYSLNKETQVWINKKVVQIIRRKYE
jgi:hypothetical protein